MNTPTNIAWHGDVSGVGNHISGNVLGDVSGSGAYINGSVWGNVFGTGCRVTGNVYGNVSGVSNVIDGILYGKETGIGNQISRKAASISEHPAPKKDRSFKYNVTGGRGNVGAIFGSITLDGMIISPVEKHTVMSLTDGILTTEDNTNVLVDGVEYATPVNINDLKYGIVEPVYHKIAKPEPKPEPPKAISLPPYDKEKDNETPKTEEDTCTICLENRRQCSTIPCGHYVMCLRCAHQLTEHQSSALKCSICNGNVTQVVRIYS